MHSSTQVFHKNWPRKLLHLENSWSKLSHQICSRWSCKFIIKDVSTKKKKKKPTTIAPWDMLLNLLIKAELPAWGKKLSSYMTNWIWSKLWHLIEIVLRRWTSYYTCILEFLQENSKHFLLHTGGVHFRCLPSEAFSLLPVNFNETFYKISHTEETKNFVHWQCISTGLWGKTLQNNFKLKKFS